MEEKKIVAHDFLRDLPVRVGDFVLTKSDSSCEKMAYGIVREKSIFTLSGRRGLNSDIYLLLHPDEYEEQKRQAILKKMVEDPANREAIDRARKDRKADEVGAVYWNEKQNLAFVYCGRYVVDTVLIDLESRHVRRERKEYRGHLYLPLSRLITREMAETLTFEDVRMDVETYTLWPYDKLKHVATQKSLKAYDVRLQRIDIPDSFELKKESCSKSASIHQKATKI